MSRFAAPQTALDGTTPLVKPPAPGAQAPGSVAITKVTKAVVAPGDGLLRWANKLGLDGTSLDEHRARARPAGTSAHANFEAIASGQPVRVPHERDQALLRWLAERHVWPVACEFQVASLRGFHGRVDYARTATGPDADALMENGYLPLVVGDFKPPKASRYPDSHLQVAAAIAALEEEGEEVLGGEIVEIGPGGYYHVEPCRATAEDWYSALDWYRRLARLNP